MTPNAPTEDEMALWRRKSAIESTISGCFQFFQCGIFSQAGAKTPLFRAALTELLINLNDLLQKAKSDGVEIDFTDNVLTSGKVKNVTDLIREMRNAACHVGTTLNDTDFGSIRFVVIGGKGVMLQTADGSKVEGEFEDDFAVYYGNLRLYIRRHALRALEEVKVALKV